MTFPADDPLTDNPDQRTYTLYTNYDDTPNAVVSDATLSGKYIDGTTPQRYTLNRVAHVYTDDGVHTYYSYDPHGNVEWVQQDLPGLGLNYTRYEYDLISGDILKLHYNEGWRDGFKHAWRYDKDNRLAEVQTSREGIIWESDARYEYYLHGPLRRAEYGEDYVQGRDYVYALHGWLKGINHPSMDTRGYTFDPGQDGDQGGGTGAHPNTAYDAFGMMLGYFQGDFTRTGSPFNSSGPGSGQGQIDKWHLHPVDNLYNGNIASWTSNSQAVNDPNNPLKYDGGLTGYTYKYDVLNRLRSGTFQVYSTVNNRFEDPATLGEYDVSFTYDPNGNILTLDRNGPNAVNMDQLSYEYYPGEGQNRLRRVTDGVLANTYTMDIDDQPLVLPGTPADPANDYYVYDEIGNLVEDKAEGTTIEWSLYGKVLSVLKPSGEQLSFIYDPLGNRVVKTVVDPMGVEKKTFYAYEAGGKVMAIYTKDCSVGPNPNDDDQDGVPNSVDNCPCNFNPNQGDQDGDAPPGAPGPCPPPGVTWGGNVCDDDVDNVGDGNGSTGMGTDTDDDNDGLLNGVDPCPLDPNNTDSNGDGIPDCIDIDGDGIDNDHDNCPFVYNPGQEDANNNEIGDACECEYGIEWVVYGNGAEGRIAVVQPEGIVRTGITGDLLDIVPDDPLPGANIIGKPVSRVMDEKSYELKDHLGNVRVVISDLKIPTDRLDQNGQVLTAAQAGVAPFKVKLHAVNNYYPFGMLQPERHWSTEEHRYGFNGKEMDNEWNDGGVAGEGTGNVYDYGFRIYDPRLGKFMSVDPLAPEYPWYTPYQFAGNIPVAFIDIDGLEPGSIEDAHDDTPLESSGSIEGTGNSEYALGEYIGYEGVERGLWNKEEWFVPIYAFPAYDQSEFEKYGYDPLLVSWKFKDNGILFGTKYIISYDGREIGELSIEGRKYIREIEGSVNQKAKVWVHAYAGNSGSSVIGDDDLLFALANAISKKEKRRSGRNDVVTSSLKDLVSAGAEDLAENGGGTNPFSTMSPSGSASRTRKKPTLSTEHQIASKIAKKYADKPFPCVDCASDIVIALKKEGISGEEIILQYKGGRGFILSDKAGHDKAISTTGMHKGVLVDKKVFDNIHTDGIPYEAWLKDFSSTGTRIITRTPF